jgi:para-nitrobenzyl esterase
LANTSLYLTPSSFARTVKSRVRITNSRAMPTTVPSSSGRPTLEPMQDAWIAFARMGEPETAALASWEPYTAARRTTMLLGPTCGPIEAPFEPERRLWDARVPADSTPA